MKAVRYHAFGEPDVMRYEDVDRPAPGPGQVLVKVASTSFNPADAGLRVGGAQELFPVELPHIPGVDLAGTIVELGSGVNSHAVGDRVIGYIPLTSPGAAAEYVVAPAEVLTAAPTAVLLSDGAALPVAALTARQALFEHGGLKAGQRVLVNGAGGGVGTMVVQLAKRAGAVVIATASPRSASVVKNFGADQIIDYTVAPVHEAIVDPVDLVINNVAAAPEEIDRLTPLIIDGGVGVSVPHITVKGDDARNVNWHLMGVRSDATQLAELVALVDQGALKLDITGRFPLTETARVHANAQAGKVRGKVLLLP
jgi:NADPH:quinone reductase-like Zn-dependent oxidoreductase